MIFSGKGEKGRKGRRRGFESTGPIFNKLTFTTQYIKVNLVTLKERKLKKNSLMNKNL